MRRTQVTTTNQPSGIQCLEVLIPKTLISNSSQTLFRTLSLYSLHSHPVKHYPGVHHSEIFHFMIFDWKRTILNLLEDRKIPFTIVRYFSPDTLYYDTVVGDLSESVHSNDVVLAVQ